MSQEHEQLKPIDFPKFKVFNNLQALTVNEMEEMTYSTSREFFRGVCLVVVEKSRNGFYVFVRRSEIPIAICSRHEEQMMLNFVKKRDGIFLKETAFLQCHVDIGDNKVCNDNIYPQYSLDKLRLELEHQDPGLKPAMIEVDLD